MGNRWGHIKVKPGEKDCTSCTAAEKRCLAAGGIPREREVPTVLWFQEPLTEQSMLWCSDCMEDAWE
jgi:hypothetical protein